MMTVATKQSEAMHAIKNVFGQFTKACQECELMEARGEIIQFWFDLAYGKIPAIFVKFKENGNELTEFVRLER